MSHTAHLDCEISFIQGFVGNMLNVYYYNIFFMMSHDPFQFLQTNIVCKDVKNTMKTNLYII